MLSGCFPESARLMFSAFVESNQLHDGSYCTESQYLALIATILLLVVGDGSSRCKDIREKGL